MTLASSKSPSGRYVIVNLARMHYAMACPAYDVGNITRICFADGDYADVVASLDDILNWRFSPTG